jgi:RimJ/RimL family protein N-acetyltransferase
VVVTEEELANSLWWLAVMDGKAVGFAGMTVEPDGSKAYLCRAGVVKIARGGGIQRRLLRARLAYALRLRVPRVWTYVWAYNLPSLRSCLRAGMLPYFVDKPDTHTWIYLEKHLAKLAAPEVQSQHVDLATRERDDHRDPAGNSGAH